MRVKTCYICKMEVIQTSGADKVLWLGHMGKKKNQEEAKKTKNACGEKGAFEVGVAGFIFGDGSCWGTDTKDQRSEGIANSKISKNSKIVFHCHGNDEVHD